MGWQSGELGDLDSLLHLFEPLFPYLFSVAIVQPVLTVGVVRIKIAGERIVQNRGGLH